MPRLLVSLSLLIAVVVGLAGTGRLPNTGAQVATPGPAGHPLIGSWEVVIAFEGDLAPELVSLITYTSDGAVLVANAGQLPGLPPASGLFFTEGHGAWASTGERAAEASFRFLVLDQTGGLAGTSVTQTTIEVSPAGDAYAGTFSLDTLTPEGNSMGAGGGTLRATRIGVEPLGTPVATPVAQGMSRAWEA